MLPPAKQFIPAAWDWVPVEAMVVIGNTKK
jgi:hypothetical protein